MKKIKLLTFLLFTLTLNSNQLKAQLQSFTYEGCSLHNSGSPSYYNYNKTFNSVQLATHDVQLSVSYLGCNPYSVNSGGIRLSGTTFVQPDVPVGNCGYLSTTYMIPKDVFNQAVIAGGGSIKFEFYIRDQCSPGMGCSFYSDPCIRFSVIVDYSCVPTSSTQTVTSCGPYTWIDGLTYETNNNTATHTLVNAAGCDSTVTLNLTVGDNLAPVANTPTLQDVTAQCTVTALTAPTATDNCAGTVTATHNVTLPITASGTTVVTWTYNDGNGNTSTQTQNVVIADNTAPVPNTLSLADLTASCSVVTLTAPTATDNCAGTITATHNATLPVTTQGTTVVTWTYDDGNGNIATQTQNIIITDNNAPVPNVATLNQITAQCEVTTLTAPTATDNCAGTVTATHDATLPITAQGTTVITWTYDDENGNTVTQLQNVVVTDNTAPVPNVATLQHISSTCSVATLTAPTATDNCAGIVTGTHNVTLPITTSGTTVVTWTYNDGNGNTSTQTQQVIIADNTAPVADAATLNPVTASCSIASLIPPTATDECAGTITGTPNVTFPITQQGTFVITWTYNDGNGNTSTQTQSITIDDQTAPVANNAILSPVSANCEVTSLTSPTATDNCAGTVTGTHDVVLPITTSGTTVVTWTYNDGNGNTSTQTQQVVVNSAIDNGITQVDAATLQADATGTGYMYKWIDCANGNTVISGETGRTFTITTAGSYACEISNGICTVTTDCISSTMGINENNVGTALVVYPNPTSGNVTIALEEIVQHVNVTIFNTLGQPVGIESFESTNEVSVLLKGEPGMYLLHIQTEGKSTIVNVIKK